MFVRYAIQERRYTCTFGKIVSAGITRDLHRDLFLRRSVQMEVFLFSDTCEIVSEFKGKFKDCNKAYGPVAEDTRHFLRGTWSSADNGSCAGAAAHEHCYRTWRDLDGYPYIGRRQVYAGGGYVFELRGQDGLVSSFAPGASG